MARIDRPTADPATGRPKGGCDRRSHVPLAVPYRDGGRRQATPGCLPMTARCASATNLVAPGTASVIPPRLTQIVNGLKRPDMADVRTVIRSIVWGSWFV